ncbi:transporter substrate-binding domain-containing protein [Calidifontibacter sp. DB0510]|uniref:Transporter substrate-binding domain-containing protein n=1 Tax=Metallococcus carri TaxID=1656884 RepID=A0A967B515_9MICO|nr:transporter substrate-binding domain-containing protein [Metallococcus carri]NHN54761.1 transporter substrate-binding domain-containing protein [Metallococcus carri]NOP37106.1 transporter substrate-binding domain-containing protein [Calidifontibacter sp. DB2511S]
MPMSVHRVSRRATSFTAASCLAGVLALSGCGSSGSTDAAASPGGGPSLTTDTALRDKLPASVRSSGVLRIGSSTTNAPFITKPGDQPVGIIPELSTAVGQVLGVKVQIVETPFPGLVPALKANRIDAIWSVMNDTPPREQTFDMVDWIRVSSSLLTLKSSTKNITSIESLCGLTAGTLRGSAQADLLQKQLTACTKSGKKPIDLKLYDDLSTAQTQVRAGKLDAFLGGTVPMKYLAAKVDGGKTFQVVPKTYLGGVFAIAIPKNQAGFSDALIGALRKVEASGTYGKILTKYLAGNDALKADEFQVNGMGKGAFK